MYRREEAYCLHYTRGMVEEHTNKSSGKESGISKYKAGGKYKNRTISVLKNLEYIEAFHEISLRV